jgi:hypothetical protein
MHKQVRAEMADRGCGRQPGRRWARWQSGDADVSLEELSLRLRERPLTMVVIL